ncbi:S8 family peptidase [candidate division KSB1 bacterium]|nr:S8 family peptidase [candidate division KSB1 bacterium]
MSNFLKAAVLLIAVAVLLVTLTGDVCFAQFKYVVDTSIQADPPTIPARSEKVYYVGVIINPDGQKAQFVESQVILKPEGFKERDAFKNRYKGIEMGEGAVADPPQKFEHLARKIPKTQGLYRIRIDPDAISLQDIEDNAKVLNIKGTYIFSSQNMLKMFALMLHEWRYDRKSVDLVGVFQLSQCGLNSTQEYAVDPSAPNPASPNEGYMDPFIQFCFMDPDIAVHRAWQTAHLYNVGRYTVPVAIIDAGFSMNDDAPMNAAYDFVDEDRNPDANEEGYHGARSLSMACAILDNRFGSAGTGGQVALPFAFRFDLTYFQAAQAIRTATAWGAEVTSQSWGGYCDWWCDTFGLFSGEYAISNALDEAHDAGVITLCSAGNEERNMNDWYVVPAEAGSSGKHPIVVGAIDLITKDAVRNTSYTWGSNFGNCDIWAPGAPSVQMLTTETPASALYSNFSGTSCACPYVAGITALMRALRPSITKNAVRTILEETANTSPDARVVPGYLNAFQAVLRAVHHADAIEPPPDENEPNTFWDATRVTSGIYCGNVRPSDAEDAYSFYLNDFYEVNITGSNLLGEDTPIDIRTTFGGTDGPELLNFSGELESRAYYVYLSPGGAYPAFYELNFDIDTPSTIAPDRFEVNNTLPDAAELVYPEDLIGETWVIDDLNFHVNDDDDFFELVLPDMEDFTLWAESVTIQVEVDSRGNSSRSFLVSVYDKDDNRIELNYNLASVEEIRSLCDGRVRFEINDSGGRRNFYRMRISYDRFIRGVTRPTTIPFFEVPWWIEAERDRHLLNPPMSILDGVPIDFPFPGCPMVAEAIFAGKPPAEIPDETMLVVWPVVHTMVMDFSWTGMVNDLNFALIDSKGETIGTAEVPPGLGKSAKMDKEILKRIKLQDVNPGYYGVVVSGKKYPLEYTVKLKPLENTPVEQEQSTPAPELWMLHQNYPNPFNPGTEISFEIPSGKNVRIEVFNILGKKVRVLVDGYFETGLHHVLWNGCDENGKILSNGVYIYQMTAGSQKQTRKMMLIR